MIYGLDGPDSENGKSSSLLTTTRKNVSEIAEEWSAVRK
jgi:hypothetical protein